MSKECQMLIQYGLNDKYEINKKEYEINASFDNILRIMDLTNDKTVPDFFKIDIAFEMLIGETPDLDYEIKAQYLIDILENYVKAEKQEIRDIAGNIIELPETEEPEKVFDFIEDADLIYSAFIQTYGIDLIEEQGKLHWAKFKALLDGLPSNTRLVEIIGIRSWNEDNERKDYKQIKRELKQKYSLKG